MSHLSSVTTNSATAKKISAKPAKSSKKASTSALQGGANVEDRRRMVSTAAYYRAERRDFNGGDEVQDWLEAEAEIDALLHH